ncbi:hypothetical protein QBC34DRAFT_405127 [Podospora aff. communis PSN243]|uniref:Carboxylesterase type B domain-containing protein n=1 Tax=Podospora aff. communis PSN243 TaxID=3040156 RepID=A0AAV9GLU0_9PEZI|nr:hypothetical protein QBC34DRAFT_405127 [Podospora aff. communis PSN243]
MMCYFPWRPFWLVCITLTNCTRQPLRLPVVDLGYTKYEGERLRNGVDAYLGMRFAAAPLGELRWRAPVEPEREEGVQEAKRVSVDG